jgi:3-oxoacyl-[acyl-carrier protein] reductase
MLLEHKHAVIYGGGGSIGGAVARAFAREGATVHLAGRTQETLDAVAQDIRSRGGTVHTAVLDATTTSAASRSRSARRSTCAATSPPSSGATASAC